MTDTRLTNTELGQRARELYERLRSEVETPENIGKLIVMDVESGDYEINKLGIIGSIKNIEDIINGRGMFSKLGESWFDDYWMNYRKITVPDGKGSTKKISTLREFVKYRNRDVSLVVEQRNDAE